MGMDSSKSDENCHGLSENRRNNPNLMLVGGFIPSEKY